MNYSLAKFPRDGASEAVEFGDAGGATEVVLTHERFPCAERTGGHEQGWQELLGRLEQRYA